MTASIALLHDQWVWWMVAVSVVMFLASLMAIPAIIVRLPVDYFLHSRRHRSRFAPHGPGLYYGWMILKNFSGIVFVFMGIAMLVLPGQGILSILIGLSLMDFPGKYQIERLIVRQKPVMASMNWIRRKAGQPEFRSNSR
ncbi:putative transmembrane protein (PGPGW) [Novipirellula aureliae]|uniref:Putative transmembrane protein (PGPGW) n=1 Tax=Novipirellula aureliae TaxID=2527966 RepID=A0A5C6EDS7_9BACT|nr:PGPGW domain-containing protein [Novipirellula aureliae]TWU45736.1 putative transmembrane protein (PGPGW) [Novipirellula aureliae]